MRILDVSEVEAAEHSGLTDRLLPEEVVHAAFKSSVTTVLFTDRRIVTIQVQMLLSERVETASFSYRSMRQFSVLEGDRQEGRSEIKIWLGADAQSLHLRSTGSTDLAPLQLLLASKLH